MLAEMPASAISLNELSRQVGLAKSNVLRYFESREAVLLELLDRSWQEWMTSLADELPEPVGDVATRRKKLTQIYVESLVHRPVLCDLLGAQAGVLEHNVSVAVAARYKTTAFGNAVQLAGLVERQVPELGDKGAFRFCAAALMSTGAIWTHSQPSAAMLEAYEKHPELALMRMEFAPSLRDMLDVVLIGLLAEAD